MRTSNPSYITRLRKADGTLEKCWTFQARLRGKRYKQRLPYTVESEAKAAAKKIVAGILGEERAAFEALLDAAKRKRVGCSMGDIFARLEDTSQQVRKTAADERRMANQLYRVLAIALDLWRENTGGMLGIAKGEMVPDREKIDRLPATVLSAETVRRYFLRALGVESINWTLTYPDAYGINSRLNQARDIFRGLTKEVKLEGLLLPDLTGFLHRRLKQAAMAPKELSVEEFEAMVKQAEALKLTNPARWAANLCARQTGMRAASIAELHKDWLTKMNDGWWCKIREGKTLYSLPVTAELAELVLVSPTGYLLPGDGTARRQIMAEHTRWLKGIIGGEGALSKSTHRLRATAAGIARVLHGLDVAQAFLGHKSSKVTLEHYTQLRMEVSDLMAKELRASVQLRPRNVVEMRKAG